MRAAIIGVEGRGARDSRTGGVPGRRGGAGLVHRSDKRASAASIPLADTSLTLDKLLSNILDMHAVSYSEARENLKAMIDKVVADRAPIAITRQRGEGAVLVSESEWASIEETLYLLQSPKNAQRLLESIAELEAGGGKVHDLIHP